MLTTFNTPFGRYRFLRMPFGILSAQEVFHKRISQYFDQIDGCETNIDDILVWGKTKEEHDRRLIKALERAKEINLTLNIKKCMFGETEIVYLGHKLSAKGITPEHSKIDAILRMPVPENKQAVQRLLGMVNYVAKFYPHITSVTAKLQELLRKDTNSKWEEEHQTSFQNIKQILVKPACLAFYDVTKPVRLQVDACKDGLGAVLIQNDRPVGYASRAITESQQRYAMIEKELLAVVFGCERFHQYIYGKKVLIESDHKPLESIFKKPLANAPLRLQRMLLRLQRYDINLQYKPGKEMLLADTLSRAHLAETAEEISEDDMQAQIHLVTSNISVSDEQVKQIKNTTSSDESMIKVAQYIKNGWPTHIKQVDSVAKQFWHFREDLTIIDEIIFKGERNVIPPSMQKDI